MSDNKPMVPTSAMDTWAVAKEKEVVGPVNSVQMAEYKAELDHYHKDTREYQSSKEKVFIVILGQCTKAVKSVGKRWRFMLKGQSLGIQDWRVSSMSGRMAVICSH
jgi:hypothetical protein